MLITQDLRMLTKLAGWLGFSGRLVLTKCFPPIRNSSALVGIAPQGRLFSLMSIGGVGLTAREAAKGGHRYERSLGALGEFRIDIESPGFEEMFSSRAHLSCAAVG